MRTDRPCQFGSNSTIMLQFTYIFRKRAEQKVVGYKIIAENGDTDINGNRHKFFVWIDSMWCIVCSTIKYRLESYFEFHPTNTLIVIIIVIDILRMEYCRRQIQIFHTLVYLKGAEQKTACKLISVRELLQYCNLADWY